MEVIKHITNEADGLEVLKIKTTEGVAVIYRDTDADQLITRRNYPAAIAFKADDYFAELTKAW